jgi:hypothetical protein
MPRAPFASRLAAAVARRPGRLAVAALLLTCLALIPASRFRLETDLAALLPDGSPGADDYRVFLNTFGGFEKVFVIVRSPGGKLEDPGPLLDAAGALAERLGRSPEVAAARAGLTEEDERFFFRYIAPRLPLLMQKEGWKADLAARLEPAAIRGRVAVLRRTLRSPAGAAMAPLFASDPLGLSEGLLGLASSSLPIEPVSGAFLSRDGSAALVMLTPARAEIDPEGGRALLAEIARAGAEVRRTAGIPLDLKAVGGPIYAAQDEELLRGDLSRTATASALGVAVLLLLGFGGGFIPVTILVSVLAGLVWTVALAALGVGSLTVIGVGFTAALVGMGVEYGIHGGERYRQLRLGGPGEPPASPAAALAGSFADPGPGIVSSALTTAAGLAPLMLAHFRPLREMGQVLTIGVLVTLVTSVVLGAPLLLAFPRRGLRPPSKLWRRAGQPALEGLVGLAARRPGAILAACLLLTGVSAWGLTRLELSTDLRSLRPADHPSYEAEKILVETFGLGLDTFSVVAPGRNLGEALDRAAGAREILDARLSPAIGHAAEITSPSDWLVGGERRESRLRELRTLPLERAADDFERELTAAGFRLEPFAPALAELRALGRGEDPGAPPREAWPDWLGELVKVRPDGSAVVAVHVRVPLGAKGLPAPEELARELDRVTPELALASVPRVGAELRDLALGDLTRSSAVALLLVAAVVLVSFRGRPGASLLSAVPLALGCLWTFGLWGAFGGHVDLLAISTLPVLFGTGIDLGVHAVHGGQARPEEGIRGTVVRSGLAMLLITLTTGVGFGSLGSSRVPGLQNAGTLVAVGVSACLLATFLVLPALESLFRGYSRGNRNIG